MIVRENNNVSQKRTRNKNFITGVTIFFGGRRGKSRGPFLREGRFGGPGKYGEQIVGNEEIPFT